MNQERHLHITALIKWCGDPNLKILHQWLGHDASHFVVLIDGYLYFYRVFGIPGSVSQDARIHVYDTEALLADGLELFYIDPGFRAESN